MMLCGLYTYSQNIKCGDTILAPNAFTPEMSTNNRFKPYIYDFEDYDIYIYNRWGQLIYEGKEWDGTYNRNVVESGVYIWIIEAFNKDCKSKYIGHITLIK